jgi:hypothetical protein
MKRQDRIRYHVSSQPDGKTKPHLYEKWVLDIHSLVTYRLRVIF